MFYLSFNPFILSSDPQHLSLSYSSNQVYCDGVYDKLTNIYLCKKILLHLADVLVLLFIVFFPSVCMYCVPKK